jgi:PTS system ascorbate-specific IIA component
MSLVEQLPENAIVTRARAADWRAAIRLAGDALVATGATTDDYTDEMIAAVDTHGPYIVVAPGFALAHSRPSPAVLRTGMSWVSLAEPVEFGSGANDPVRLVVGLAAVDHDAHLSAMSGLAAVLADEDVLNELIAATSADEVRRLLVAAAD